MVIFVEALPLAAAAQEKLITIGSTNPTGAAALPFVMAEKKGLFKKEGLNAAAVIMQHAVVVNGVLSRNLDYGAAKGGLPVRVVMSLMDGSDHALVGGAAVKRVEDLKGKRIGISSFGGAARYMSLESGAIHATMLVPPLNQVKITHGV